MSSSVFVRSVYVRFYNIPLSNIKRNLLSIPQPYHLPGYTGTCPGVQYRYGKSFGVATHLCMCDPSVMHARKLALSCYCIEDLNEDYGQRRKAASNSAREQLEQEVRLLKGITKPRSIHDQMVMDCPRLPLTEVTVVCQGYKRPIGEVRHRT